MTKLYQAGGGAGPEGGMPSEEDIPDHDDL